MRYNREFYPACDDRYAEELRDQFGLDEIARRDIPAAIVRTVADKGRTVLFSSHFAR